MNYRLEDLSPDDFEKLVNMLCQKVLGMGTVRFAPGKDGGRDGRFEGTANDYPSHAAPWKGKFIIQAKHTSDYDASCTDGDFFENKSSILKYDELPKIKKLKNDNEVDNYLLFTNRKETSKREEAVSYLKREIGLSNVDIIGKDTIHSWLSQHDDIARVFKLGKYSSPFEFYDQDIRDVIKAFHGTLPKNRDATIDFVLDRPHIEKKNSVNGLDTPYYENIILEDLNRYHQKILTFLYNPINTKYAEFYEETAQELKRVIETHREDFNDFKKVFDFLTKSLTEKEPEKLKKYRNIIPVFFHFMYYRCDIGREK
jgi:hypothetical protein